MIAFRTITTLKLPYFQSLQPIRVSTGGMGEGRDGWQDGSLQQKLVVC